MKKLNASVKPPAAVQMEEFLERYIFGQPKPIEVVAKSYSRLDSGFKNFSERYKDRPIGCFFLLGPSGVGKTELAKRLAQFFHKTRSALTIIECVDYNEKHEVAKLTGAPPGYVGHGDPPRLCKEKLYSKIPGYQKEAVIKSRHKKTEEPEEKTMEDFEDMLFRNGLLFKNMTQELILVKEKVADIDSELQNIQKQEDSSDDLSPELKEWKKYLLWSKRAALVRRKVILNDYLNLAIRSLENVEQPDKEEKPENQIDKDGSEEVPEKEKDKPVEEKTETKEPVLIILFDEIEKAHPSLYDFLLQIMEEGKTTLGNGEEIDLRNAFIFMTSNAGSGKISDIIHGKRNQIGFTAGNRKKDIYETAMAELRKKFSNEFLSRLDEVLVFNELTLEDYGKIFDLLLQEFRLSLEKKLIKLVIAKGRNGESVKKLLLKESSNKPNQARFLQDLFRKKIVDPVENLVTTKQLNNGEVLIVTAKKDELIFINYSRIPGKKPS